jgi:hypothetical protein
VRFHSISLDLSTELNAVVFDERFHSIGLNDWMSHLASFRAIEHYFLLEPSRSGEDTETREYLSTKEKAVERFSQRIRFFPFRARWLLFL